MWHFGSGPGLSLIGVRKFIGCALSLALPVSILVLIERDISWGQVTNTQIDWTYTTPNEQIRPKAQALGNYGTFAASAMGVFIHTFRAFSAFDPGPSPTAFISNTHSNSDTYFRRVAASKKAEVSAIFYDMPSVSNPSLRDLKLEMYSTRSAIPVTATLPFTTNGIDNFYVQVAADGSKVVAVADNIWEFRTHVKVYIPTSSTPIAQYSYPMNAPNMDAILASDGIRLLLRSGAKIKIVNISNGAVVHDQLMFETLYDVAFSPTGTRYAYSTISGTSGIVKFYKQNPATQVFELEFSRTYLSLQPTTLQHIGFSLDGQTAVYALSAAGGQAFYKLFAYDLSGANVGVQLWEDTNLGGGGSFGNYVTAVALSDNGIIAVGASGDGSSSGTVDELRIYNRASNVPIASFNYGGSITSLDISPDGHTLLVGRRSTHDQVFSAGGSLDLINIGARQVRVLGVPHANSTVTLQFNMGVPNVSALLLRNSFWANPPMQFPLMGTLFPGRIGLTTQTLGTTNSAGSVTTSFQIPGISAVGSVVQGAKAGQRRLTERGIQISPVP